MTAGYRKLDSTTSGKIGKVFEETCRFVMHNLTLNKN